ncbi:MAG: efflux RND transporter periplasmic adaptor subunit [Planctomycetota bacterium]
MRKWLIEQIKYQFWPLVFLAITGSISAAVAYLLIWPAYKNPIARMYTSSLGYSRVLRETGQPFPVKTAVAVEREITGTFIGEGIIQSEPVQVPMIAMAGIEKIFVDEGDYVEAGQMMVELDDTRIRMRIEAAAAALETARAEFERVKVGSVNVLLDERPALFQVELEAAENEAAAQREILERYRNLLEEGALSQKEWLEQTIVAKEAEVAYRTMLMTLNFAIEGRSNSIRIAEATIKEAEMAWKHRLSQLEDFISYAPASGIVERILVHEGEYNQDPGRPAIIIASGLWFEASMDQTAMGQIEVGNKVELRLSAFQDRTFSGTVHRIKSLVNFATGGPETNRPVRPKGTGAPEWPATFQVLVHFDEEDPLLVPGLTGFSRISNTRTSICVPRGTVTGTTGNRGLVYVVNEDGESYEVRDVAMGWTRDGWTEIVEGVEAGEVVIADGYQVLEPGDPIAGEMMEFPEQQELMDELERLVTGQ